MELILELLNENRRISLEWRSAVCAAAVAVAVGGICHYLSVSEDHMPENAAAVMPDTYAVTAAAAMPDMESIVGNLLKAGEWLSDARENITTDEVTDAATATTAATAPDAAAATITDTTAATRAATITDATAATNAATTTDVAAATTAELDGISANHGTETASKSSPGRRKANNVRAKNKPGIPAVSAGKAPGKPAFAVKAGKKPAFKKDKAAEHILPPAGNVKIGAPGRVTEIIPVPDAAGVREISGFICDGRGRITGYRDSGKFLKDSLAVLPRDSSCTGIAKGAFKGLEGEVFEIYITANITYIEEGAFDSLTNLVFIEADPKNPAFYSVNGVLYTRDGKVFAYPSRMM